MTEMISIFINKVKYAVVSKTAMLIETKEEEQQFRECCPSLLIKQQAARLWCDLLTKLIGAQLKCRMKITSCLIFTRIMLVKH